MSVFVTAPYIVSFELFLVCCLVKVSLSGSPSLESASAVHARNVQSTLAPRSIAKKKLLLLLLLLLWLFVVRCMVSLLLALTGGCHDDGDDDGDAD